MPSQFLEFTGDAGIDVAVADLHDEPTEEFGCYLCVGNDVASVEPREPLRDVADLGGIERHGSTDGCGLATGLFVEHLVHLARHDLDQVFAPLADEQYNKIDEQLRRPSIENAAQNLFLDSPVDNRRRVETVQAGIRPKRRNEAVELRGDRGLLTPLFCYAEERRRVALGDAALKHATAPSLPSFAQRAFEIGR